MSDGQATATKSGAPDPLIGRVIAERFKITSLIARGGMGKVYRAEQAGTFVVRVSGFKFPPAADVKLAGEAGDVYRLTVGTGPVVRYAMPAGVRRGAKGQLRLFDWFGGECGMWEMDASGASLLDDFVRVPAEGGDGTLNVALGDGPEVTEADVHAASQAAAPLTTPVAVTGRIERPGEEDAFRFAAKKGERLAVALRSTAIASPMDLVLRLEDEAGKQLASNDDERGAAGDARLDWTAPADGVYRAVVGDLFGKAGHEYVYRLSICTPAPGVVATVDADEYRVVRASPRPSSSRCRARAPMRHPSSRSPPACRRASAPRPSKSP